MMGERKASARRIGQARGQRGADDAHSDPEQQLEQ